MALTCPHIIWRISPFYRAVRCLTDSFEFFGSDWRWEYYVHTKDDDDLAPNERGDLVPNEMVSIYLKRLTDSRSSSLSMFCTIVSIKDSAGDYHSVKILNHKTVPQVSWRVWNKLKSDILSHDVIESDSCTFSLTLEPLNHLEDTNSLLSNKNRDVSCLEELSGDYEKLLEHSKHADIILKCGDIEIKAHKDVLRFRSAKFAGLLEQKELLELFFQSMDTSVFVIFLRYIYTATLPVLTNELARKLYEVAEEFSIDSLKKRCMLFIIENLSNSNALETLLFADKHNDDSFKWAVSSHITCDRNILYSEEWKNFSITNQKLAIDVFEIFTEKLNKSVPSDSQPV